MFTLTCTCGAQTVVDKWSLDKVHICQSCRAPLQGPKPPPADDPPPLPPGTYDLLCACGTHLLVRKEFIGKEVVCNSCRRVMKIEAVRDPRTQETVLKVTVIGEIWKLPKPTAQEKWSLEDFS